MAFRDCFTFFLIFFSFFFLTTSTLGRPQRPQIVVDIVNALPNDTQVPFQIGCEQGDSYLKPDHHYNRTVKADEGLECTAQWLPWFNTWDAYEVKRDKGHDTIYWKVMKDGFYLSWDGSNWKMVDTWYTE